jgi:hypothetical protein
MARRVSQSGMESQYFDLKVYRIHPFQALIWRQSFNPWEAKTGSTRVLASPDDEETQKISKDTIEGIMLQTLDHINKYQVETVKWQDRMVKLKLLNQVTSCFEG